MSAIIRCDYTALQLSNFIIIEWKMIVRIQIMCANSWLMWSKKEQLIVSIVNHRVNEELERVVS